ncbi:sulfotransferase [Flavobacteriales bacterium]|nr:sulfotransferase [Flavobacteriales bacterium]
MSNKLPNFLIVGAAKSGTSSLHNYLNQHPQVFMPSYNKEGMKVKEPRFLIKDLVEHRLHNGVWTFDEYQLLFNKVTDEKAIGESTVLYLYYFEEAIKNIKYRLDKNTRIIIMLRNPVDRAFSAYNHVARSVKEQLSFEEALEIEHERLELDPTLTPMVMYKDMGLYCNMVKAYLDNFENVHIIMYEDFKNDTAKEVKKTLEFLGLDSKVSIDTLSNHNVGGKSWKTPFFKHFFVKDNLVKKLFRKAFSFSVRKKARIFLESILKQTSNPIIFFAYSFFKTYIFIFVSNRMQIMRVSSIYRMPK